MDFKTVTEFELKIADFFGAKYAVAVDSCTHGIELCLRLEKANYIVCPKHTYLSIPMLANKLNIQLVWKEGKIMNEWVDYYQVHGKIIDAAVLWRANSYISGTMMSISFQYQKHLSLGRGGIILLDDKDKAIQLKKMSYDGRLFNVPWREQNIDTFGFHYYLTPETAQLGLDKLDNAIKTKPRQWIYTDWPDISKLTIFK